MTTARPRMAHRHAPTPQPYPYQSDGSWHGGWHRRPLNCHSGLACRPCSHAWITLGAAGQLAEAVRAEALAPADVREDVQPEPQALGVDPAVEPLAALTGVGVGVMNFPRRPVPWRAFLAFLPSGPGLAL